MHRNRSYLLVVVACLALATTACGAGSPVAPVAQSVTPAAPVVPMGTIEDGQGNPIAGATVSFWPPGISQELTNGAGQFPLPQQYVEVIQASKAGYEGSWDFFKSVLRLHEILRIPAGQSVRVTIRPDDSLGGSGQLRRVRRIRVFSNGDRIVHIQVLADDNGAVDYMVFGVSGEGCYGLPCPLNPSTFFVDGGGERGVELQMDAQSTISRTFTVVTRAEDP